MTQSNASSMYRQAALDAHFAHQYGQVTMLPKCSQVMLSLFVGAWVVVGIVFISTQPFHDTVEVSGWVETSVPNVTVRSQEQAGIVEHVLVANGDTISKGQAIATIRRSQGDALGQHGIKSQQANIQQGHTQQQAILAEKQNALRIEAMQLTQQFNATRQQIASLVDHQLAHNQQTEKTQTRWLALKEMAHQGTISVTQLEQSELQVLSLQQGKLDLFVQSQQLTNTLSELTQRHHSNQSLQTQYEHETRIINLQTEQKLHTLQQQMAYTVRASANGIVDNLQANVGESVGFQQVLMQISPIAPDYFVRLAIPSYQAAFIQLGQRVQVKVDGFPYQHYGSLNGTVSQMANEIIMPADLQHFATPVNAPVYLIDISIELPASTHNLKQILLRSGMTIQASIEKQQGTILEWLIAPLFDSLIPSFRAKDISK